MVLEPILAQSVQSKTKLKAADFCQKYKCTPNAVLLDARPVHSKPPHDSTLITGAIRVPEKYMLQSVLDTVGFDRPIFVFCSEGKRSETIVAILVQKHYQKVYQLDGGLDLCLKKGFNPGKTRNNFV